MTTAGYSDPWLLWIVVAQAVLVVYGKVILLHGDALRRAVLFLREASKDTIAARQNSPGIWMAIGNALQSAASVSRTFDATKLKATPRAAQLRKYRSELLRKVL